MDLIKAKTILSRLQSMQQSLETDAQLSSLEKDLILSYLRELYEIYNSVSVQVMPSVHVSAIENSVSKPIEKEIIQKTLEFKFGGEEHVGTTTPTVYHQEVPAKETPMLNSEDEQMNTPTPVTDVKNIPSTTIIQSSTLKTSNIPASILELFEIKKSNELSDKLNDLPLRDINRAIGINDKLEIISSLFGGQKQLFDQIITDLNSFKNYDEAMELLGFGPAIQYKWDHEDRRDKASEFIRLIRRRYL